MNTEQIVIGIDSGYNFLNFANPDIPKPLALDVVERTLIEFMLSDFLMSAGWRFQERPFGVGRDYGVNFSSYGWMANTFGGHDEPFSKFRVIFECVRQGEYEYSLFMLDPMGQKITLDPKIRNGAGW